MVGRSRRGRRQTSIKIGGEECKIDFDGYYFQNSNFFSVIDMTYYKYCTVLLSCVIFLLIAGMTSVFGQETDTSTLPESMDLTARFEKWELRRINQGSRPTCSVCTVVGAIEYANAMFGKTPRCLSVEFANWAKNDAVSQKQDGGFFSNIWRGYRKHGLCSEKLCAYGKSFDPEFIPNDKAREEAKAIHDVSLEIHWIKRWNPKNGLNDEQFTRIKTALSKEIPVCAGMRWPHKARRSQGILLSVPEEDVYDGHSVLLVGYQDDESVEGGGYFLIRNTNNPKSNEKISYLYIRQFTNDAIFFAAGKESDNDAQKQQP